MIPKKMYLCDWNSADMKKKKKSKLSFRRKNYRKSEMFFFSIQSIQVDHIFAPLMFFFWPKKMTKSILICKGKNLWPKKKLLDDQKKKSFYNF